MVPSSQPDCHATTICGDDHDTGKPARVAGCSSVAAWNLDCPQQVRDMRRCLLVAASWVHQRFSRRLAQWPWKLLSLGDDRFSEECRKAIWLEYLDEAPCCLQAGMARQIQAEARAHPSGREWLRDEMWIQFWRDLGQMVTLQIADVEWRHSRNRSRSNKDGKTAFTSFESKYILGEALVENVECKKRCKCLT